MIPAVSALVSLGQGLAASAVGPHPPAAGAEGASFEGALGQAIAGAVDSLKTGEAAAIQGVSGAAPPMRVVESMMDAQRSLQSMLAVRDKLVSAWQDIARMQI